MGFLKYPGGKDSESDVIRKYSPASFEDYYEPFVGGGAVYLDISARRYFINDFSQDLINLYTCVKEQDEEFFQIMDEVNAVWKNMDRFIEEEQTNENGLFRIYRDYKLNTENTEEAEATLKSALDAYLKNSGQKDRFKKLLDPLDAGGEDFFYDTCCDTLLRKMQRMKVLEYTKRHLPDEDIKDNITCCLKGSFYMYMRHLYNHPKYRTNGFKAFIYLFIRDMCYSGMFRFNSDGKFNVPYGGLSYNNKTYDATIVKYRDEALLGKLAKTTIGACDYYEFLQLHKPSANDFMFVDPPYDSEFCTYDQNSFDQLQQKKLANYLINECDCKFMLDIKSTEFIQSLYPEGIKCKNGEKLRIIPFDKKYSVSFMDRNDKRVTHLLIMNYSSDQEAENNAKHSN